MPRVLSNAVSAGLCEKSSGQPVNNWSIPAGKVKVLRDLLGWVPSEVIVMQQSVRESKMNEKDWVASRVKESESRWHEMLTWGAGVVRGRYCSSSNGTRGALERRESPVGTIS